MKKVSRRNFVKLMSNAGLAVGIGGKTISWAKSSNSGRDAASIRNFNKNMKYRTIGDTDIHSSVLSIGTGSCEKNVLQVALDRGLNLIHTSTKYSNGNSIKTVAEVINGKREKVHIALKDNFKSIEEALKILGTDYIDIIMFNRHNAEAFKSELPEIKKKFLAWRKKGLVKYAGLTTHKQMAGCIDAAVQADFFSAVMPTFGPQQLVDLKGQIKACSEKNISIIAMKTKAELGPEEYLKQIKTVLSDKTVCTINKTLKNFDMLEQWSQEANKIQTGFFYRKQNASYALFGLYAGCQLCGKCEEACPNNVATADVVRCIRYYHDAEKNPAMASWEFEDMKLAESLSNCKDCGRCEKACPAGIPVKQEMKRALQLIA